jgi:hypothetical protein
MDAFANSTVCRRPTAALTAATTASNGLEDITLNLAISTLLIAMSSFLSAANHYSRLTA